MYRNANTLPAGHRVRDRSDNEIEKAARRKGAEITRTYRNVGEWMGSAGGIKIFNTDITETTLSPNTKRI